MKIMTIGIDLAKNVFQIHGVDGRGKVAVRKQLKRAEMSSYFANLESAWNQWQNVRGLGGRMIMEYAACNKRFRLWLASRSQSNLTR